MSWDPIWEDIFKSRGWGKYPPEELIRFVAWNFYGAPDRRQVRILELGCGPGANLWYLSREGFDAHGIDASTTAVAKAGERLAQEGLSARRQVGDVATLRERYLVGHFDCVLDITCIQCNLREPAALSVNQAHQILKPGGKYLGMMAAQGSWGDGLGRKLEEGTYTDIPEGPCQGTGVNRFFPESDLRSLFSAFAQVEIEHSIRTFQEQAKVVKHWVVQATK